MINLFKDNIFFYLFFFTLFLFALGISAVEISVLLLTLSFLFKNRCLSYYKDKKSIFLFLFATYIAVNAFFQITDDLKISSFFFFRYILFALAIHYFLDYFESNQNINKQLALILFGFLLFLIFFDSYFQFFTGKNLFGFEIINERISSIFGTELILGSFLLKILPLFVYFLIYTNIEINKNFLKLVIFFSIYFTVIYLAAGRTSFFLMILFILLMITFVKELRKVLNISIFLLILFVFITQVFEIGKSNPSNRIFLKTFNEMTSHIFYNKQKEQSLTNSKVKKNEVIKNLKIFSSDHQGHYILAYELFKKNIFFGIGPKGFRYYCRSVNYNPPKGICSTHPHNFLVQILSETGLLGLLFYFFGFIFIVINIFKSYCKNVDEYKKNCFLVISIALVVNFFPFVPNGNFFNNWLSITSFYYIGIYLYSYRRIFL